MRLVTRRTLPRKGPDDPLERAAWRSARREQRAKEREARARAKVEIYEKELVRIQKLLVKWRANVRYYNRKNDDE